ncbi:MAG: orotate phosphoribosyltransferase [Candidatus Magasanikbacteria bacterium RIFOXYD2_FULL_41_14]|uniref:Orotate phosphoribosyltransferase n=1 Tax=Candidatus Magasanikbacteria bacterium RIFOXYD2_FULL_41_14 TaxID=1798709 RepID=A0A1F6PC91_9BACT|nr:MAG: orotate phosphoribosyltransferase [Candidatus Magasanikbacteria bacterium RIFOXYD2_FULL_41_14]
MNVAEEVANILLEVKAVTLSVDPPYTWTSGIKAPIYCDNRLLISYPDERNKIIKFFIDLILQKKLEFDIIAGTATAGIPWAAFLANELNKPMVYVRPQPKGHGRGQMVEGTMPKNSRVLIVEDLISTGGSSLRSAQACQDEYDAIVVGVLAIFNYQMNKSKISFEQANIPLYNLSDFTTLIETASKNDYLKPEDKEIAMKWNKDPETWTV